MSQADVIKMKANRLASVDAVVVAGPTDGGPGVGSDPHFQMSPVSSSGLPTTGFIFMFKAPSGGPGSSATAGAGGFSVTAWFRDPVSYRWGASTTVSIAYNQTWICADVDAMDGVVFQIGNVAVPGSVDVHFCEQ